MFEKIRYRDRLFGEYVPWRAHFNDNIIYADDRSTFAMFEVDGLPWETSENSTINQWHNEFSNVLRNIASDTLILHAYQCRGAADPGCYPHVGKFRSGFSETLDMLYRERLFENSLYHNRIFLGVQMRPQRYAGEWVGEQVAKRSKPGKEIPEESLEERVNRLEAICGLLGARLSRYQPRRLGIVSRENGGFSRRESVLFSEIPEALAFALTGLWRPVPLNTGRIGNALLCERIITGPESIEIRGPGRSHYAAMFGMREYPDKTWPGMLGALARCEYRSTVHQSFRFIAKADAEALMSRKQNRMVAAEDKAHKQIAELDEALNHLMSNDIVLGDHSLELCVFAGNTMNLNDVATAAWRDLSESGVVVAREDKALEAAWVSMIPGNGRYRVRPGATSNRNYAAMAPMHNFPAGADKGFWGDPTAVFRTMGGTPYRFHLHHQGVGNTFVTGKAGSGKTVWLGFIICQADRSGAQTVLFDKDRGLEILARAVGGSYLRLQIPTGLSLLKGLTNTPENRAFQAQLIRGLIVTSSSYEITQEEERRLHIGLRAVMRLPPSERWLGEVRAFLGTNASGAGARLDKWCWGNEFGGIVDCPKDELRLDAPVIGFDQTDILDNPMARGPVMAMLYHRIESLIDGRRLLFVIDEFWKSLLDEAFTALVNDKLKTLRKNNSPMILATQSPADALKSPISHTIMEQCPTSIAFSNSKANWNDYGPNGMQFTYPEYKVVKELPEGQGIFLCKQGERSVLAQLPLDGMADEIAVLSGGKRTVLALDAARAEVGEDAPASALIQEFHRKRRELV